MTENDYVELGLYLNKSARTLKRWEIDNPLKFSFMVDEWTEYKNKELVPSNAIVVVFANFKGGVGKSTSSGYFCHYLDDAVVVNVDLAQSSKDVNACDTVDYINLMKEYTLEEVVKNLSKKYKYIIIDTPGDSTPLVEESVRLANRIVIPMTLGKRARLATEMTLETLFGEGTELTGDYKIYFFFNGYTNKKKREQSSKKFQTMYTSFKKDENVSISSKLGAMDYSDAIVTAEEEGKSIFALASQNKGAYKSVLGKMNYLCMQMENHLEL